VLLLLFLFFLSLKPKPTDSQHVTSSAAQEHTRKKEWPPPKNWISFSAAIAQEAWEATFKVPKKTFKKSFKKLSPWKSATSE
jgi:hypothetical protein